MLLLLLAAAAQAESWCASPLVVHEWGVQVLRTDGAAPIGAPIPDHFHRSAPVRAAPARVRDLPADTGARDLPVLHFYAPLVWGPTVPVGIEVGFTEGRASAWYPQVDRAGPAGLEPQLVWDSLMLTAAPTNPATATDVAWVDDLRGIESLWVNRGGESERYLFYEADTTESPSVVIERGASWSPDRPHHVLRNRSAWTVHDVFVVHHGPDGDFAFFAPAIPPGRTAGFLLDAHAFADPAALLTSRLVDPTGPPTAVDWTQDCVMMRDPAVPAATLGHHLYPDEMSALLDVWKARLFDAPGTTIVYREDTRALDAAMPLAVYTDMYHHVDLRRTGLVVWEAVDL